MVLTVTKQTSYSKISQRIVLVTFVSIVAAGFLPNTYYDLGITFIKGGFVAIMFVAALNFFIKSFREIGDIRCSELELEILTEDLKRTFPIADITQMRIALSTYVGAL